MMNRTLCISLSLVAVVMLLRDVDASGQLEAAKQPEFYLNKGTANHFIKRIKRSAEIPDILESITERVEGAWEKVKEVFEEIMDVDILDE